eukprot:5852369-Amphidinium_carterae.1
MLSLCTSEEISAVWAQLRQAFSPIRESTISEHARKLQKQSRLKDLWIANSGAATPGKKCKQEPTWMIKSLTRGSARVLARGGPSAAVHERTLLQSVGDVRGRTVLN